MNLSVDQRLTKRSRTSSRMTLVGICAWISVCLLIAGWIPAYDQRVSALWLISGMMGLVSSVGLAETIKADMRMQDMLLKQYMQAAMTDGLTGLLNRQSLDELMSKLLDTKQRHEKTLSLIMIDIDRFKALNDQWGHQAGDAVLRHISRRLEEFFREYGVVARYGGEEFAVVLTDSKLIDADRLADECRRSIKAQICEFRDQKFQVTISCGVTTLRDGDSVESFLCRADLALYTAKKMGRDCIWVDNPQQYIVDDQTAAEAARTLPLGEALTACHKL